QLNFVATQIAALALAPLFRSALHPSVTKPATRHAFALVVGLVLGYFAFGKQAIHLAGLPSLCYVVIRTQDPHIMQRLVMVVALVYLSCIHLHRLVYDTGTYSLDVTGPLMVMTQKATSLAFSLHDGLYRKEEELNSSQKYYAIRKIPSALEYFSYMLQFQSLMVGPIIFYRDYIEFIHGSNLLKQPDSNSYQRQVVLEPSPTYPALQKIVCSIIYALIFTNFISYFPMKRVKEDDFFDKSMMSQLVYLYIATGLVRFKYYHAWILADGICNLSGIGFNGYESDGAPKWDLISNVDVLDFEFGLSLRDCIQHWNKGTNTWLRMVVYDRVKVNGTLWTYALSALWHGFYPGYYLTFATGALFTLASRSVRRCVRPHFLSSPAKKTVYDFATMFVTRVAMTYTTFSFVLLEFWPSVRIYWHMYFWLHLLALGAIYALPRLSKGGRAEAGAVGNKLSKLVTSTGGVNTLHG
ncbi:hypothetical protein AAG570_005970, partial [Ranatra chinensis]